MSTTVKKNIHILIVLVTVVISVMLIGRSLAYFTSEKNHDSQYEVSVVDTYVEEDFKPENENTYIKNPRIVNQGKSDAIVRVRYDISNGSQKDNVELIDLDGKNNWVEYEGIIIIKEYYL